MVVQSADIVRRVSLVGSHQELLQQHVRTKAGIFHVVT